MTRKITKMPEKNSQKRQLQKSDKKKAAKDVTKKLIEVYFH